MNVARAIVLSVLRNPKKTVAIWLGVPLLAWIFDVEAKLRATGWLQ